MPGCAGAAAVVARLGDAGESGGQGSARTRPGHRACRLLPLRFRSPRGAGLDPGSSRGVSRRPTDGRRKGGALRVDPLIRRGEVIDPGGGYEGSLDVAITRGRIAAVARDIPAEAAFQVIDAGGQYVTPGLIDLHTHIFRKVTYWGIDPDPVASQSGVTTWNDAGSAGGRPPPRPPGVIPLGAPRPR